MLDQKLIYDAVRMLMESAPPGSGVVVFGSHARGDAGSDSDVDFLVVEPEVADHHRETVRLYEKLRPLGIAADVMVTSRERYAYWRDTPNTVYYDAAHEGMVYGQVA